MSENYDEFEELDKVLEQAYEGVERGCKIAFKSGMSLEEFSDAFKKTLSTEGMSEFLIETLWSDKWIMARHIELTFRAVKVEIYNRLCTEELMKKNTAVPARNRATL